MSARTIGPSRRDCRGGATSQRLFRLLALLAVYRLPGSRLVSARCRTTAARLLGRPIIPWRLDRCRRREGTTMPMRT